MKLLLVLIMIFMCSPVWAADTTNIDIVFVDEVEAYEDLLGLGFNIKLWKFKNPYLDNLGIEAKYDFNNNESSVFIILNIDLTPLWQK